MTGYSYENGMSNNAVDAYNRGVYPLSQITASDLRAAGWTGTRRLAVYLAKAGHWHRAEWHHSGGTWFNEVDFFDPAALVEVWEDVPVDERAQLTKAAREAAAPSAEAGVRVRGTYTIWGGSRRRPRHLGEEPFTGELRGDWIHIDGGGRKKATGRHITWSREVSA